MTAAEQVPWQAWGPAAFKLAQEQNRPIVLDLGAVWCHWCHVMDQTTYSDPEVIALIKDHFVPIKVDTDRRPDINSRYNQGGWPTTAFLAPMGELLVGFTYLPPEGMVRVLRQVHEHWQANAGNIRQRLAALRQRRRPGEEGRPGQRLEPRIVEEVLGALRSDFDGQYGGFGLEPKFPQAEAVRLLLEQAAVRRDGKLLEMARKTLDGMLGLYDQVHGGLYRYAVNRQWSQPHYEKRADVNAGAIENYVQLYQATGEDKCLEVVAGIIGYLGERLFQEEEGCFGASQDADVGSHDPTVQYVPGEAYFKLDAEGRGNYPEPYIDRTMYADANAMLASALLRAYAVTAEGKWAALGRQALDNTWAALHRPGGGVYHYLDADGPKVYGLLADQALMLRALLDAYEILGELEYLERAREVVAFMQESLADGDRGGYYDQPAEGADRYGALAQRTKPLTDNAVAAEALLRLHHLTGEQQYEQAARRTLEHFAGEYEHMGIFAAGYANAVDCFLREPTRVVIVAGDDGQAAGELHRAANSAYVPWKVVQLLEPERDRARLADLRLPSEDKSAAYVCVGRTCTAITDAAKLKAALGGKEKTSD